MVYTYEKIRNPRVAERSQKLGATHLIVATDTFDYEDYPVFVMPNEDVKSLVINLRKEDMTQVMEVYLLKMDLETQINNELASNTD